MMIQRSLPLLVCAGVLLGGFGVALARPTKIALTKIEGDANGVGKAVTDALEDSELVIVPPRQVDRTLERLGLDDNFGDRGAAKLGEELEVDAVVRTAYDRRRGKMRFTIFAFGAAARRIKPFTVDVDDAQSDKFRRLVRTTVMAKLTAVRKEIQAAEDLAASDAGPGNSTKAGKAKDGPVTTTAMADDKPRTGKGGKGKGKAGRAEDDVAVEDAVKAPAEEPPVPEDEDTRPAGTPVSPPFASGPKAAPGTSAAPASEPAAAAPPAPAAEAPAAARPATKLASAKSPQVASARDDKDGSSSTSSAGSLSTRTRVEPGPRQPRGANLAAMRAELGMSMSVRSLTFEATAAGGGPKPFSSAAIPGARFEGELYPFAMNDTRGVLAGFGIGATFDQAVPLTVTAGGQQIGADERHFSIGLRYRFAFGHTPTSPTLTVGAGYGSRMFSVDRAQLANPASLDMPDVDYKVIDPGLAFRMPLGKKLTVSAAARGLLVTGAGQIQQTDQYGAGTAMGMSGNAGVEYQLFRKVALRVAGEATQVNFDFTGTGARSNNRDGNPATVDVKKASDTYLGGVATLAVVY